MRTWTMPLLTMMIITGGCSIQEDNPWELVWSDEFTGEEIDSAKWKFDIGNGFHNENGDFIAGWGNSEKQYYTGRNVNARLENSSLIIEARREYYGDCAFTSAKLKTQGLFSQAYGKFEFRAKLPVGRGVWPALWLLPETHTYGGWAASGEIDIMEAKGSKPNKVSGAIHFGGGWPNNVYATEEYTLPNNERIDDFHVYALEWEPDEIRWYVDGALYQTQKDWYSLPAEGDMQRPFPAPFDQPFHVIINLAIGGHFDGDPDETTEFPAIMEVDYVRVYKKTT